MAFSFKKLWVWQQAKDLCVSVYQLVDEFPSKATWTIGAQMNKSALSVPSNIAEGTSRRSMKDQTRFTEIAYGSLMELLCQTIIAKEVSLITDDQYTALRSIMEDTATGLSALRNSQLRRKA